MIKHVTDAETRLTAILRTCTEALEATTAERGRLQKEVDRLIEQGANMLGIADERNKLQAELASIKGQEPVDAVLLDDMVEGQHPDYGRGLFTTDNCVKKLYLAAGAQPECEYCDGTGDVHSLDGEWRGRCNYAAGAQPVQNLEQLVKDSIRYGIGASLGGKRLHPNDLYAAPVQAGAQPPDDFDSWSKNPYTLVLQKSIAKDYIPKGGAQEKRKPLTMDQKKGMWRDATIEMCHHENCYLRGIVDAEAAHGIKELNQ